MRYVLFLIVGLILGGCGVVPGSFEETPGVVTPTDVHATALAPNHISVTWSYPAPMSLVTGFIIYRNGVEIGTSGGTSFSDWSASPGTSYCYTVAAHNFTTRSDRSASACATTPPDLAPPSSPANLSGFLNSASTINLIWDAAFDDVELAGYKIFRNGAYLTSVSSTSFSDAVTADGSTYCYRVLAYDTSNNESGSSNDSCVDTSWRTAVVDGPDNVGTYPSIGVDSLGHVHLVYRDETNHALKYATNASGSWGTRIIDLTGTAGMPSTSLAVDSHDKVHICYYDNVAKSLKYATDLTGSWTIETLDPDVGDGAYASLAVDRNDAVHVVYMGQTGQVALQHVTNASGGWTKESIDTGIAIVGTSIAVDAGNHLHVAYYVPTRGLGYATNAGGSWEISAITTTPMAGGYNSIAVDRNGKVHIAFQGPSEQHQYTTNASGAWETVTFPGYGWGNNSIAVDGSGAVHICYHSEATRVVNQVWYQYNDLIHATNASGHWSYQTLDSGNLGELSAIAVDGAGKVHVGYWDMTQGDLRYASNR